MINFGDHTDHSSYYNRKLLVVVGIFLSLSVVLGTLFYYSNKTLTATRAYVTGEALWSKAQKEAVITLYDYVLFENPSAYEKFQKHLKVNKGDLIARKTLSSEDPDYQRARTGLLMGNIHPEDIDDVIWLFENFHDYSYFQKAIQIWEKADQKIKKLRQLGEKIHQTIQAGDLNSNSRKQFVKRINKLDNELTTLEKSFSAEIGKAARHINRWVFWIAAGMGGALLILATYGIYKVIIKFNLLNKKLLKKQLKLQRVLENSRDIIYEQNLKTGEFEYISGASEDILGYSADEIQHHGPEFIYDLIHPDDTERILEKIKKLEQGYTENGSFRETEYRIQNRDGEYIWINNQRSVVYDRNNKPACIIGNVRDVSDRKQKEEQLNESLKEKQLLLSEVHHRIKNNLAVVSGILMLQADEKDDQRLRLIIEECQNRIKSIAELHELLYESSNFSEVELEQYLENLLGRILKNTPSGLDLDYELSIDASPMKLSRAVHFGLLINELSTNSIKHAFPNRTEGSIYIAVKEKEDTLHVTYSDDGVGYDSIKNKEEEQEGVGMKLINTLLTQLGAEYEISSAEPGFRLDISF